MKTVCSLLLAITLVFLVSLVHGADWVYMGTDEEMGMEWSYDVKTLTESQAGTVRVRVLSEYSDEGREKEIQWRTNEGLDVKNFGTLSHDISLCEVNCLTREYRLMEIFYHSTDGNVLYSHNYKRQSSEGWRPVPPGTMAERLYQSLCPPKEEK